MEVQTPLNADVLRHIFWKLASSNTLHLTVTQPTGGIIDYASLMSVSQVCIIWRQVALGDSNLWARAICLYSLGKCSALWRKEIMRRTTNRPLFVYGEFTTRDTRIPDIFSRSLSILSKELWDRVEVLAITCAPPLADTFLTLFRDKLAPTLKSLSFFTPRPVGHDPDLQDFPLNAPLLRECQSNQLEIRPLTDKGFEQLQTLSIKTFRIAELLSLLKSLPELITLEVRPLCSPTSYSEYIGFHPPCVITLNRIQNIKIHIVNFIFCPYIDLLNHLDIQTNKPCSVHIVWERDKELRREVEGMNEAILGVFKKYLGADMQRILISDDLPRSNLKSKPTANPTGKASRDPSLLIVFESESKKGISFGITSIRRSATFDRDYASMTWIWRLIKESDVLQWVRTLTFLQRTPAVNLASAFCRDLPFVEHLRIEEELLETPFHQNTRAKTFPNLKAITILKLPVGETTLWASEYLGWPIPLDSDWIRTEQA